MAKVTWIAGALFCVAAVVLPANADIVQLVDKNSSMLIDTGSQDGMSSWLVDRADHMNQQWFWYRVGDTDPEASIDTLHFVQKKVSDTDWDAGNETVVLQYREDADARLSKFTLELKYVLTGGETGDGYSDIAEIIKIVNTSGTGLAISLFQYCDLDLNGDAKDDSIEITGGNTARQTDDTTVLSETVVAMMPDAEEAAVFSTTLDKLNDAAASNLSGNTSAGPDDVTWAFQWDFAINPDESVLISKNKVVVPEPATAGLLAIGGVLLFATRRRRRSA
jgi:hypothetical protein